MQNKDKDGNEENEDVAKEEDTWEWLLESCWDKEVLFYISTFQLCTHVVIKCLIFVIRKKASREIEIIDYENYNPSSNSFEKRYILVNKLFNVLVKLAKYRRKTFDKRLLSLAILRWSFVVQLSVHSRLFLYLSLLWSILINNPNLYHWYLVFVRTQEKVEKVLDELDNKRPPWIVGVSIYATNIFFLHNFSHIPPAWRSFSFVIFITKRGATLM